MNCPQCNNEMVTAKATAFGDTYLYCRTCKKELAEMEQKVELDLTWKLPESAKKRFIDIAIGEEYDF